MSEGKQYTNSWAVEVKGGEDIAKELARKHGFDFKGKVRHGIADSPCTLVSLASLIRTEADPRDYFYSSTCGGTIDNRAYVLLSMVEQRGIFIISKVRQG